MSDRSTRREVRNPVLALDGVRLLATWPAPVRRSLAAALRSIRRDALLRAEQCWRSHKAPMAAYWKAVGVYSGHIARAIDVPNGTPAMTIQGDMIMAVMMATGQRQVTISPRDLLHLRAHRLTMMPDPITDQVTYTLEKETT